MGSGSGAPSSLFLAFTILISVHSVFAQAGCQDYYSKGVIVPQVESVNDTIMVPDAFPLGSVQVTLDVSHRRIGALVVSLTAKPPADAGAGAASRQIVLKERGLGQMGDNLYMTTFSDKANTSFPVSANAAPFRGTFLPTQRLSFFTDGANTTSRYAGAGGSQGAWSLRIDDVAPNATIRPIALNGWMLHLCPADFSTPPVLPQAAPTPEIPSITNFQGPPAGPIPAPLPSGTPMFGGWKLVMQPGGISTLQPDNSQQTIQKYGDSSHAQQQTGSTAAGGLVSPGLPPIFPSAGAGLGSFQTAFNSYLQGRYGTACTDPSCTNVKLHFWKAALGLAYLKAKLSGKEVNATEVLNKMASLLPGPNPVIGKLSDVTASWDAKKNDILKGISTWYDQVQSNLSGNMDGLKTLLSGLTNPGGMETLKALGIDPTKATSALGPMLGLENPQDAQALMDGLNEAGFGELMKDFLSPGSFSL